MRCPSVLVIFRRGQQTGGKFDNLCAHELYAAQLTTRSIVDSDDLPLMENNAPPGEPSCLRFYMLRNAIPGETL